MSTDDLTPREEMDTDNGPASSRRDSLKKGLVVGGVAAAVWVAPTIKGLSVVPDYASAGTNTTGLITFRLNGFDEPGSTDGVKAAPNPAVYSSPTNPSKNATNTMVAPLGPAGNATLTFPQGSNVDDGPFTTTVRFDVDPPFNKCRVVSGLVEWDPGTQANLTVTNVPIPNTTASTTASLASSDAPLPTTGTNFIQVVVQCQ